MLEVQAQAKINLYLEITGRRPDGYHELDMIMQTIDFSDRIAMERAEKTEILIFHGELPEENSIKQAAMAFFRATGMHKGAKIAVEKRIPAQAGLGGASADAAAVLKGLNELYGYPLRERELEQEALTIGADVPFCLRGGCCRARGIGEKLDRIVNRMNAYYLIVKPKNGVSTPEAYMQFHRHPVPCGMEIQKTIAAVEQGKIQQYARYAGNMLTPAAVHCCPEIRAILQAMENAGAPAALMTGSGSACVAVFREEKEARRVQRQMEAWDLEMNRIVRATDENGRAI